MNDEAVSIIRTLTPLVAGWVITWLVSLGFDIDQAALERVLYGLFSGLYYLAARMLEAKWPKLGRLLGVARQPSYQQPSS